MVASRLRTARSKFSPACGLSASVNERRAPTTSLTASGTAMRAPRTLEVTSETVATTPAISPPLAVRFAYPLVRLLAMRQRHAERHHHRLRFREGLGQRPRSRRPGRGYELARIVPGVPIDLLDLRVRQAGVQRRVYPAVGEAGRLVPLAGVEVRSVASAAIACACGPAVASAASSLFFRARLLSASTHQTIETTSCCR